MIGLVCEAGEAIRIAGKRIRQHLDGEIAIELGVSRSIDRAHAAFTGLRGNLRVRRHGGE